MITFAELEHEVAYALREDVGSGDISAELIAPDTRAIAKVISREAAVLCGQAWFEAVFRQIDPAVVVYWLANEGQSLLADQPLCYVKGCARSLLTGERTALNFLQTLSGTATEVSHYVQALQGFSTRLLDTRKTLPGLRHAQKYAVSCGGASNHRMGLYDAFLIKENHIASCGSITEAVKLARKYHPDKWVEVEVEDLVQLEEALAVACERILLDNFSVDAVGEAVRLTQKRAQLEVSGAVDLSTIREYAALGVDFISVGALTKHVRAIDLSMRISLIKGG